MSNEIVDTLVVGGGQAGIAMSEHLSACSIPHVVLERHRIAERWRNERWDSLVANGPAWHDCFPSMAFPDTSPDGFAPKSQVVDYLVAYADKIKAPLRTGVEVIEVVPNPNGAGFQATTSQGVIEANNVVAATGPFQRPIKPLTVPESVGILQLHSTQYRNPKALPDGAVLVVGAGSSGAQIANELMLNGRQVYLSIGPHDRPPRRYRGRDYVWWLGVLGKWSAVAREPGTEHVTISVSGAYGGKTVEFRQFAHQGMTLLGRTMEFADGKLEFADDLNKNLKRGDANYLSVLDEADEYIRRNGIDLPEEPEARVIAQDPACVVDPIRSLDLEAAGIGSIIWATGFTQDFSWLKVNAFDSAGSPQHIRGVSNEPGIYFLGLPWLASRASSFLYGVWFDAKYIADQILTQRRYRAYEPETNRR
ncbi:MAG: flavin-containing monooxygenase [Gammaproteobacteria bacterium]